MIVRKAALRPVPSYAVVEAHTIHAIEGSLAESNAEHRRILECLAAADSVDPTVVAVPSSPPPHAPRASAAVSTTTGTSRGKRICMGAWSHIGRGWFPARANR